MGCGNSYSQSTVLNRQQEMNKPITQRFYNKQTILQQTLYFMQTKLKIQKKEHGNFHSYLWQFFRNKVKCFYFSKQQILQLYGLLEDLIRINFMNGQQNKMQKIEKVGKAYGKLFNRLHFKQEQAFLYLQIMISSSRLSNFSFSISFFQLKFDLSLEQSSSKENIKLKLDKDTQKNQLLFVTENTYKFCKHDMDAIAFLSLYIQTSTLQLFQIEKDIKKIEQTLKNKIKKLCNIYPQIQQNKNHNQKSHQQLRLQKVNKENSNFEVICFSKNNQKSNFNQLQNFIIKKSQNAKDDHQLFYNLVGPTCKQYGYGFLSGVKIKNKNDKSSIWRTIQKLLQAKQFQVKFQQFKRQVEEKYNGKLINKQIQLLQYIQKQKQEAKIFIQKLVNETSQLVFDSKDLVRGKCIYNNSQDIIKTITLLKTKIKQKQNQGYEIIELKNQLSKKNMVKVIIKLPKSIAELQLVAKLQKISNEFNHKLYEIARSKIYTIVTNLFVHHQKWSKQFFSNLQANIHFITQNKIDLKNRKGIDYSILQQESERFFKYKNIFKQKENYQDLNKYSIQQIQKKHKNIQKLIELNQSKQISKSQIKTTISLIKFLSEGSQFEEVLKVFEKLKMENIPFKQESIEYADILVLVGNVYKNLSKYDLALQNYQKSLSIYEKLVGKDSIYYSIYYAQALMNIGIVQDYQSKYDLALQNYKKSLSIYEKLGKDSMHYAQLLNNIAVTYQHQNKYDLALQNYQKSLQIKEKLVGKDSTDYADILSNMAVVYDYQSKYDLALQNYQKTLSIYEKQVGKDSLDYARILNNIALVYDCQSKYDLALQNYQKSLSIKEKIVGKDSMDYGQALNNIGIIYKNLSKYDLAILNYQESLQIYEKLVGNDSLDYAKTLNNIAVVYQIQTKYDLAIQNYQKSLSIKEKLVGKDSIDYAQTLENIGSVYKYQSKYDLALQNYMQSLSIKENIVGKDSMDFAMTLENIGMLYKNQSKYDLALQNFQKSISIYEKIVGKDSVDYADIINNIANVQRNQTKYDQALQNYQKSLSIYEKLVGKFSMDYANTLYNISIVYENKKEFTKAYQAMYQTFLIDLKLFGQNHSDTIDAYQKMQNFKQKMKA